MNKKFTQTSFAASLLSATVLSVALLSTGTARAAKNTDDFSAIKKDIKVISKVLSSSTELENSRSHLRVSGRYLAKQGIVLNITFPHSLSLNFNRSFDFSMPDIPGVPSVEEIEAIVEDSLSHVEGIVDYLDDEEEEDYEEDNRHYAPENDSEASSRNAERRAFRAEQKALRKHQKAMEKQARKLEKQARKLSEEKRAEFMKKNKKRT